jgi:transposase
MELISLYKRVIGLDVHQAQITACALIEGQDGQTLIERRTFGAFKRDRRALADWCARHKPDVVVMESTGIYWKSPYAYLEEVGIRAFVVNARHVKQVPGRKTDVADAEWLATLARAGLLRASFVPPAKLRALRLVSRQRQKLNGLLASEKNRLGKVLANSGIRLGVVVSDLHGKSARAMTKALIGGATPEAALAHASKQLKSPREAIEAALEGELGATERFVAAEVLRHIEELEAQIARFDAHLLTALSEPTERNALTLLQTIPGVDRIGAAMLLVEVGITMSDFRSADALASWSGLCPGNNESAGKRRRAKSRKGNPYVRRLLCEFANAATKTRCAIQAKYQALVIRTGRKRAIIACAHKMLRIIFFMLRRNQPYRDTTVDFQALIVKRNAPRWIRELTRHGFLPSAAATR